MDGPARRSRSRLSPTAADFVPAIGEDPTGAPVPPTDDDTSVASWSSLDSEDPFDSTFKNDADAETGHVPAQALPAQNTYDLDANESPDASSLPSPPGPSPSPSRPTSLTVTEVPAEYSAKRSKLTLRDWLTPPPTAARRPQGGPNIAQSMRDEVDRIQGHEERRIARETAINEWGAGRYYPINGNAWSRDTQATLRRPATSKALSWSNSVLHGGFRVLLRSDSPLDKEDAPPPKVSNKRTRDDIEPSSTPPDDDDDDPSDPGADNEATMPLTMFHSFLRLPSEIREKVYAFALSTGQPILPQLCDLSLIDVYNYHSQVRDGSPRFHDANQPKRHDAIYSLLGITRVSKLMRSESLPVFYAANTFFIGKDTSSYFDRLEYLGRFEMMRNVQFRLVHRLKKQAPETLRGLSSYLKDKAVFEASLREQVQLAALDTAPAVWDGKSKGKGKATHVAKPVSTAALVGATYHSLIKHPQYLVGGLADLNVLICLGKLCTASPSPSSSPSSSSSSSSSFSSSPRSSVPQNPNLLTLPIPLASVFATYPTLSWFPRVATGLGITLRFVEGVPVDDSGPGWMTLTWRQRWGKKQTRNMVGEGTSDSDSGSGNADGATASGDGTWESGIRLSAQQVRRNALALNPGLEEETRSRLNAYYRVGCGGLFTWFDVFTEKSNPGGGGE